MPKCLITDAELSPKPSWVNSFEVNLSPIETVRRILSYRNLFHLHRRTCDATKKAIISIYPQNADLKVYDKAYWFGDDWDPLEYGQTYNPLISIFDQFNTLVRKVPQFSLQNVNSENADYCNSIESAKDCYLAFVAYGNSKDIYYSYRSISSNDIYFSTNSTSSELLFHCFSNSNCYENIFCDYCKNSQNCLFSFSLENCKNCVFSNNLQNKENYIFNKPASAQQVKDFKLRLNLGSYKHFQQCLIKFNELKKSALWKSVYNTNCENVTGNELINCNNCFLTFVGNGGENFSESFHFSGGQNNYRCFGLAKSDNMYMSSGCVNSSESDFLMLGYNAYQCQYCVNIHNCKNCFFCSGLRNKEYCILNKQYTKEQYFQLKEIIIAKMKERIIDDPILKDHKVSEWGQWFPSKYSFFPYNKSYANAVFPLSKEEALRRGFSWDDEAAESLGSRELYNAPDLISEWTDNLDNKVLQCEESNKYFNLIPQVVKRFKEYNLSFQRIHPMNYLLKKQTEAKLWLQERQTVDGKSCLSIFPEDEVKNICIPEDYNELIP